MIPMPGSFVRLVGALAVTVLAAATLSGQTAPGRPLQLVTSAGIRPVPTVMAGDVEMIALDDLAALFGVDAREDTLAQAFTIAYQGKTIVLSQDQALASIGGRLVSLPAAPARIGNRWHVPVEVIGRALAVVFDTPLELRKASRLVIQGALRVPRVAVRHDAAGTQARVVLDVTPAVPHQIVQEAGRLLVRFEADLLDLSAAPVQSQGFVQAVRVGPSPTTVLVELGPRFGSFRGADTPIAPTGVRITLDIFGTPEPTAARPDEAPGATGTPGAPAPSPSLGVPGLRTIVIDAGHGGEDAGARGAGGTLEKSVTLAVALALEQVLEARLGARVLMTREGDREVNLDERAALANNNKADLFLSLHANASVKGAASGAEIFVLSLNTADEAVRQVVGSRGMAMPVFGGGSRDIDVILWEMAQARHVERSSELARLIETQLRGAVPLGPRPVQRAPLRVLVGANMPAVLIEMGYLTNTRQESQLASKDFQTRLVSALVEAIGRFFAAADQPEGQTPPVGGAP